MDPRSITPSATGCPMLSLSPLCGLKPWCFSASSTLVSSHPTVIPMSTDVIGILHSASLLQRVSIHFSREFCKRVILCNSVVWSCALTGKPGLTYQEALDSERNARQSLKDFPKELRAPVLYLASLTHRTSFGELSEDVFSYVRERYFVGEHVEVWFNSEACVASLYHYEVEKLDSCNDDVSEIHLVEASHIKRRKGAYTRERSKLFLKQHVAQDKTGLWVIKPRQQSPTKQQIFSNKMSTKKTVTLDKKKSPSKQLAKKLKDKYAANSRKDELNKKLLENHKLKNVMIPLQKKNVSLQEKQKRIEEKLKEREKRKEEKARLAEYMKEWNRHREDLELEDLKVLPMPSVINCGIPDEHFGDFVMILEFFQSFRDILSLKSFFPGGVVSFEVMVRALVTKEVAGEELDEFKYLDSVVIRQKVLNRVTNKLKFFNLTRRLMWDKEMSLCPLSDMIQMLLQTLFNMQEEEDDEILETNNLNTDVGLDMEKIGDVTTSEAMKAATAVVNWSQLSQGTPLNKLSLDAVALSEVLRLHLLSSGGRSGELSSKWRYQQRGGYTSLDDPGLQLRIEHPHILRALSITSVCELPLGDKVKVLTCLINQILTYAVVRDVIDERGDKMKQIKADLKAMQVAESKKEREATALRIKEKKEAKLRLAESNPALPNNSAIAPAPPSNIGVEEPEKSSDSKTEEACKLKVEKERLRKKQEWLKKTQDMHQAAMGFQLLPLGLDRGYRRYWLFSSLSGLFVENDERFPGVCLSKATPCDPNLARLDDTVSYVRKLFEEERNCGSDKENDVCEVGTNRSGQVLSPSKKLLAESGLTVLNVRSPVQLDVKAEPISEESKLQPPLLVCTTNRSTCPVHSSGMSRTKWAYFSTEEEIVSLIKSLNKRGVRESDLRRTLIQQQERVVMNVKLCPVRKLDKSLPDEDSEQRKSTRAVKVPKYDDSNLGFPTDMAVETVLNLFLRDSILQLEDKIEMGGLGSLQWVPISLFYSILISPPSVVPRDPSNPVEFGLNPGQVETRDRRLVDKFGTGSGQLAPSRVAAPLLR
uniref:DDT domain-containing protein n=1 Tax=Timema bartmani TaxID=61472 RepID=A0A7R9HZM7_9NEOP|nr:unnamed protein product [Timema bartmani]